MSVIATFLLQREDIQSAFLRKLLLLHAYCMTATSVTNLQIYDSIQFGTYTLDF